MADPLNRPNAVLIQAVLNPAGIPEEGDLNNPTVLLSTDADGNLRTSAVAVLGGSVEISNDVGNPVPVNGTVAVSNLLNPQPVSGPLTDAQLRAVAVPVSAATLPLPTGAATSALQTQPGVDIGDVTVNNGAGASAVNIQDGGNSITVDGPLTDAQLRATSVPISLATSYISTVNSSTTNLAVGNAYTFTGTAEQTTHPDIMLVLFADQATTILIQFSTDGVNWDSTITKKGTASANKFTTSVKGARWVRVVVTTASLTTTVFRLSTQFGMFRQGNLSLNAPVSLDADALVVRPTDHDLEVSRGLISSHTPVNKFGRNPDIDIGTEDIWGTGGTWVQPTAATIVNFVSSSVLDTAAGTGARTLTISGLDGSYNQVSETLTLNGIVPVATALSYFIIHRVEVATAGIGETNAGVISSVWTGGGTPVGPTVSIGKGQSQFCIYQIPAGYTGYLQQYGGGMQGGTALDLELFVKPFGGVFNLKHTIPLNLTGNSYDRYTPKYPLKVLEKGIVKLTGTATANNTDADGFFDLVIVAN